MRLAMLAMLASACSFKSTDSPGGPDSSGGPIDSGSAGCPDTDHDGVCDADDKCPGFDDHVDTDGDGIPDGCDDWPCGAKPTAPNQTVDNSNSSGWKVENTMLGGAAKTLATVKQNTDISLSVKYSMVVICFFQDPSCDAEIKYGHDPGGVDGCLINGTFNNPSFPSNTTTKTLTFDLDGSTQPTVFKIKLDADGFRQCSHNWSFGTPGDKSVIAEVCVTP